MTTDGLSGAISIPLSRRLSSEWQQALTTIGAVFLATRLVLVAVAISVELLSPVSQATDQATTRPVIGSLTTWDAVYYLGIAREGYHQQPIHDGYRDWVFFPAYPAVVRAASILTLGDFALAGILVSNLAFVAALILLYALSRRHLEASTSRRAVVYLAIAPGAVAFAMAYSESLFLLFAVAAFLAAERGRWVLMALAVAAATLTRLPGVLLLVPLAVLIWDRPATSRSTLGWLVAGPLALAAFGLFQWAALGDPLAFLTAQQAWDVTRSVPSPSPPIVEWVLDSRPYLLVAVIAFHAFLLGYFRPDRIPRAYVAFATVSLLTIFATQRLASFQRYVAIVWPFDWILAGRRASWFRVAWPVISIGLFAVFAALHFSGSLAP